MPHTEQQEEAAARFGPSYREVRVGRIALLAVKAPLRLECGAEIRHVPVAYQTYGTLNAARSNAILLCHGLTGDQYAAGIHPVTGKPGWWEALIGPGRVFDTDRFFVIASNVIGGCMGSFGPKEISPATGAPYGIDFPVLTIGDMVEAQALLMDYLGIARLFAVVGGSMGGMVALEWAARFPARVASVAAIATSARHSAQNIAFHEIGRQAIMADPEWQGGRYLERGTFPAKGLAVARMTAHVTYLSEQALQEKFGRSLQERQRVAYGFDAEFQVESYLRHQGSAFVERFDPNSYLYITRAVDYFDLTQNGTRLLADVFRGTSTRFCIVSFSSDWLFPTSESRYLARGLSAAGANVSFTEIASGKGHDAFLLDEPEFHAVLQGFFEGTARLERSA